MAKRRKGSDNCSTYGRTMRINIPQDMRRFDKLPPPVRAAMRELPSDMAAKGLMKVLKHVGAEALAKHLLEEAQRERWEFYRQEFGPEGARQILGEAYEPR